MAESRQGVPNNVYTVLTLIALAALLVGVAYVAMRSKTLFGSINPLDAAKDLGSLILPGRMPTWL